MPPVEPTPCQGPEFCIDDICASSDVGMCGIPHPHTIGERCSSPQCYECMDDDEPDDGYDFDVIYERVANAELLARRGEHGMMPHRVDCTRPGDCDCDGSFGATP